MISVDEAVLRIASAFAPLESETVPIGKAFGRVLAADAIAALDQPPAPVSSMDGYAVRASDVTAPASVRVIGSAPAGHPFAGRAGKGEAVRIFTGGVVPEGVDAIVIQEDAELNGNNVLLKVPAILGRHIRLAGLDFKRGAALAAKGHRLTARDLSLLAAGDVAHVEVHRRPRIVFAATGDELSRPGEARKDGGIVASSGYGLAAMIETWGGEPHELGILPDTTEALAQLPDKAAGADMMVTLGGASVGDHDLVKSALAPHGFVLDFWRIAMRPGKPLIFGKLGNTPLLGLPGNPVSTLVCALLFLKPAIAAMQGTDTRKPLRSARLARDLAANDTRQDYIRARLEIRDGELWAEPFKVQDSSMLSVFAAADALVVRMPHAVAAKAGDKVDILVLDDC
jgi:molybdopterin molybdotransferase